MISQESDPKPSQTFRLPRRDLPGFLWSAAAARHRSIALDGRRALAGLPQSPILLDPHHIPPEGPCLVVCNHFTRPGFGAWWLVLLISGVVAARRALAAEREIHWVMTASWTFPEHPWRRQLLTPLTRRFFARIAKIYGFIPMPPMPPAPEEVAQRAAAVRQTLRLARLASQCGGMVGLAPEGRDHAGGLAPLPPGAGDFMALLAQNGLPFLPVGVGEESGRLRLAFGACFKPEIPPSRRERDRIVGAQVMGAIASLLP